MALTPKKVYAILNKKIEHGGATDEQIQSAITSYLDAHPEYVGATEEQELQILENKRDIENIQKTFATKEEIPKELPASDVYEWAKQPEKPEYTAEEVGALPSDTRTITQQEINQIEINRQNLLKTAIKRTDSGKIITLSDSAEMPFAEFRQYGWTKQRTTTGAQLFDVSDKAQSFSGSANDDGWITASVDNTDGAIKKYSKCDMNPSKNVEPDTYYLAVVEIKSVSGISQFEVVSPYKPDGATEWSQFATPFVILGDKLKPGIYTSIVKTRTGEDFEGAGIFLRTVLTVDSGKSADIVFRISIYTDITITADTFVYEPYTGGIPAPNTDYPQELVSAGDKGSVGVDVLGQNILNPEFGHVTYMKLKAGTKVILRTKDNIPSNGGNVKFTDIGNKTVWFGIDKGETGSTLILPEDVVMYENTLVEGVEHAMYVENEPISYQQYTEQALTMLTPNGFPGIPVSSGGNYTDENGQQWIADEIALERGVYIKRVGILHGADFTWDSSMMRWLTRASDVKNDLFNIPTYANVLCSHAIFATTSKPGTCRPGAMNNANVQIIYAPEDTDMSSVVYMYQCEPIETPIPAEELAAYRALHTNTQTTTIVNDEDCWMEVGYAVDTKEYIDSTVEEGKIMIDTVTGKKCILGMKDGLLTVWEVTE